jgi:sulfopyruvate decarboxylase subunit beta
MMDSLEAQKVISQHRGDAIVIATMTASREWPHISSHPDLDLDFAGAMGKASSFGLGLALALPARQVIVLDGDGSLLMNLGSLVTIASMAPPNLIHFVFENGNYRNTGGQPIPNTGKVSFRGLAEAAGYPHVYEADKLEDLAGNIETILKQPGPTFVCLRVQPLTRPSHFPWPDVAGIRAAYARFMSAAQRGVD